MKKLLLTALLLCMCAQAQSAEVAGVKLTDSVHLGNRDLVFNGAGVRTKFFLKVYVAALYLVEKQTAANAIITDENPQRVALHMLRDLSDEKLLHAFNEAIAANHTKLEMTQLDFSIKRMTEIFHQVKEVKTGDVITMDYLPGSGTQISVNGIPHGAIPGGLFHRALLKIWLGEEPVQADLKLKLLGGN
jgi:flagellar motor switch/type III secretory pathway protein FliN